MSDVSSSLRPFAGKLKRAYLRKVGKDRFTFVGFVVACTLLSLFVCFVLDYLTGFPGLVRLGLTLGVLGYFCGYLVLRRRARVSVKRELVDMARDIELRAQEVRPGGFYSVLVSATEFSEGVGGKGSAELRGLVVDQADGVDFDLNDLVLHDAVGMRRTRRLLLGTLVVYVLWGFVGTHSLFTFMGRAFGFPLDYRTRTQVVSVDYLETVARFEDVVIRVDAKGVLPGGGELLLWYKGARRFAVPLAQDVEDGGVYRALVERPLKGFKFVVCLGDYRSRSFAVEVVRPPVLESGRVTVHWPLYTGLADRSFGFESFDLLEGATFDVEVVSGGSVKRAVVERGDLEDVMSSVKEGYLLEGLSQRVSSSFSVRLLNKEGVENRGRLAYDIRVVEDVPPVVDILLPKPGAYFAPQSFLRWRFKASDDFGMDQAVLLYRVMSPEVLGDEGQVVKASAVLRSGRVALVDLDGAKGVEESGVLVIRDLDLRPGDVAELRVEVLDRNLKRRGAVQGLSAPLFIHVVSASELKSILSEELYGAHLMIQDVQADIKRQRKTIGLKLRHSKGGR